MAAREPVAEEPADIERPHDGPTGGDGTAALTQRALDHGLLRQAVEFALAVARIEDERGPSGPIPGQLRPLLRHAKLTARTRSGVARVIDTDEAFRLRVAELVEDAEPEQFEVESRLWLTRPDGWEEALAEAVGARGAEAGERRADREERQARRQVESLTAELGRRQAELDAAVLHVEGLEAELAEARRQRRDAQVLAETLEEQLADARTDAARWRVAAETAEAAAGELRRELAEAAEETAGLRAAEARVQAQVADLGRSLAAAEVQVEVGSTAASDLRRSVALAVGEAATAAGALGEALAAAAATLGMPRGLTEVQQGSTEVLPEGEAQPPPDTRAAKGERLAPDRRPGVASAPRRAPLPLPPATFDDSPEAAAHLVRTGVLLLVDGYNVCLFGWPELPLPEQRHHLTSALAELAARTGASVRVIFDGDEEFAYPGVRGGPRDSVRVSFSPRGVEADEVIIHQVEEHPAHRPVVVATNDRRVQDEVRERGANVITTTQLLVLLRRATPN